MVQITSTDLSIGRGVVWLARHDANPPTAPAKKFRDVGNSPGLNLQINASTVEEFSSDGEQTSKSADTIVRTAYTATLTIDSISPKNLALFFLGDAQTKTVGGSEDTAETFTNVELGYGLQLGSSVAAPTGARGITIDHVVLASDGVTPLVEGVDYEVDTARGFLILLETSTLLTPAECISGVTVQYDIRAHSRTHIISGSTQVAASMWFHASNPMGERLDYFFPLVLLRPRGDLALISDEWRQVDFDIEILPLVGMPPVLLAGQPVFIENTNEKIFGGVDLTFPMFGVEAPMLGGQQGLDAADLVAVTFRLGQPTLGGEQGLMSAGVVAAEFDVGIPELFASGATEQGFGAVSITVVEFDPGSPELDVAGTAALFAASLVVVEFDLGSPELGGTGELYVDADYVAADYVATE